MLTKEQLAKAKEVHKELFQDFVWTSDEDVHGVREFWDRMVVKNGYYRDDCDSFAMEMDFRLKTAGVQLADRRLAMCSISRREIDHCALVLNAEDGWMVSECNSQHIVSLDDLPYTMWYLAPENGQITEEWVCL